MRLRQARKIYNKISSHYKELYFKYLYSDEYTDWHSYVRHYYNYSEQTIEHCAKTLYKKSIRQRTATDRKGTQWGAVYAK